MGIIVVVRSIILYFVQEGSGLIRFIQCILIDVNVIDFIIVEYKDEIGGRVYYENFGCGQDGKLFFVEYGVNWVQGLGKVEGLGMLGFQFCFIYC